MTEQYQNLLKEVISKGDVFYEPRTKEQVMGISAFSSIYDLREGFPNLTTKNVPPRLPFEELFWKLRGERNIKSLVDKNVNIWTANAFDKYLKTNGLKEKFPKHSIEWNEKFKEYSERIKTDSKFAEIAGDLGPVYGFQWRHWKKANGGEVDQLEKVINGIKNNPGSRYHVLNAWNVGELENMALGPCPFWHQFSVFGDNLDLTMVQRSNDSYLGNPFNQAQDALFLILMANETGLTPRYFNHQTINTHIYLGVAPRAYFWKNEKNVKIFKKKFQGIKNREDYMDLRDWYLKKSPPESEGNEKKDHMPFILEQLSKEPKKLPSIEIINPNLPLLEAIQLPALDVVKIKNYEPHKWKSKAEMAA
jgi:thymidylate synthase